MSKLAIWRDLEAVHFVHEWDIVNRHDRYLEEALADAMEWRTDGSW